MTGKQELLEKYTELCQPLVSLAKRAYGPKDQDTPAHAASREYTRLLSEFNTLGGSLTAISKELGVSYSGIRRRVFTADVPSVRRTRSPRGHITAEMVADAATRVRDARDHSTSEYHRQLHAEFTAGIPMNMLARQLGISNAAPLYYGINSHEKRNALRPETAA